MAEGNDLTPAEVNSDLKIETLVPDDNIKEKVVVAKIATNCDSAFHYLINVRFSDAGVIKFFNVWPKNSPQGYKAIDNYGRLDFISRDFGKEKYEVEQTARLRAWEEQEAKRQAEQLRQDQVNRENTARAIEEARKVQLEQDAERRGQKAYILGG